MEKIHEHYEESYKLIPSLCEQMLLRNPRSVATCSRDATDEKFSGCCIAFNATLKGWKEGCMPVLRLDGCHLKGKYGGCLLSITALDENNGLFPLAIYICRSEGYQAWFDFLLQMEPHLKDHTKEITFISYQQKGLQTVIEQIFPNSFKRFCFRHMYQNFKKDSNGGCYYEKLVWNAARVYWELNASTRWIKSSPSQLNVISGWLLGRNLPFADRSLTPTANVSTLLTILVRASTNRS